MCDCSGLAAGLKSCAEGFEILLAQPLLGLRSSEVWHAPPLVALSGEDGATDSSDVADKLQKLLIAELHHRVKNLHYGTDDRQLPQAPTLSPRSAVAAVGHHRCQIKVTPQLLTTL